jgi:CRP-like cAMP-binding protein
MLSSDKRDLVLYHNERHLNELFDFFDRTTEHLPFINKSRSERLARIAIYLHDLGYFSAESELLSLNHEQRSKDKVREFFANNPGLLSEAEVDAIIYMIDKTQLKIGDVIKNEVSDDNRAYDLLNRINNRQESGLTADDWKFLKSFLEKNFSNADSQNLQDRQLVMDTIFSGKTLALADVWGQAKSYLYMIALLSPEFRHDKQIMLDNNDPNAANSPATMTNLEQMGATSGFQSFAEKLRLKFFLNSADYPLMGMQQYLEASLIDQRQSMIKKSKRLHEIINDLLNGIDKNLNILGMNKNTDQLVQVIELKQFIEEGVSLGIYNQAQKAQLISEINSKNGLIARGMENQFLFEIDAFIPELAPTVDGVLINSEFAENLSDQEIEELLATMQVKQFVPNQEIIQQGISDSKGVFLVISGRLDVFVDGGRVAELSQGKLFGEMSVLEHTPRNATVSVSSLAGRPAVVAEIPADVFHKLIRKNSQLKAKTEQLIKQRRLGLEDFFAKAEAYDPSNKLNAENKPVNLGLTSVELAQETTIHEQAVRLLGRSRICDLPNRQRYVEDLVGVLKENKIVQVAYLSIQNFKGEFNDLGVELDKILAKAPGKNKAGIFGHYFGDWGIQAVAAALPRALNKALAQTGIKATVYNDAKSYWVVFENVPDGFDTQAILNNLLKSDSDFRQQVVAQVKATAMAKINAAGIEKATADKLSADLNLFTINSFNIYGGISQPSQAIAETKQGDMIAAAQALDAQAILEAKYQQIGLEGGALRDLVNKHISQFNPFKTAELLSLKQTLIAHMHSAKLKPESRIGMYSDKTWLDAQLLRQYGEPNELESMYAPISRVYDQETTDVKLLAAYQQALEQKDAKAIAQAKLTIYRKITVYNLDNDLASRAEGNIYTGNDNFKIMINYLILKRPKQNWSGTFRIGGDEIGKLVWDAKNAYLSIYRFDINNLGKTNFQWGMRVGDKLIDEILRLVNQIDQDNMYMRDIYAFFNNQPNGTGKIFADLRWQLTDADYLFILSELKHQGKNAEDYISIEANKYFLKKIPEVNIPLRDPETGQLLELYKGLGQSLEGISAYESTPAVSAGVLKNIPANAIHDQLANDPENNMVDVSVVQGRADGAAEKVKGEIIKKGQAIDNGEISESVFAQTDNAMVAAEFNPGKALASFEKYEPTLIMDQLAEYMLAANHPESELTSTVGNSDYSAGIITPVSADLNQDNAFQLQQSI